MPDDPVIFYRLQACPFCERVARLLREYDVPYRSRYVETMHSDRDAVQRAAGVRSVPVIVDERTGVTMAESGNVVEYLEAEYGGGADAATDGGSDVATDGAMDGDSTGGAD